MRYRAVIDAGLHGVFLPILGFWPEKRAAGLGRGWNASLPVYGHTTGVLVFGGEGNRG